MKRLRVSAPGMQHMCELAFCADGMSPENAKKVAANLVFADLRGVSSHGVVRLKSYIERSHREGWNRNPAFQFSYLMPALCRMSGDNGFGSLVGTVAMEKAMELAGQYGVGVCSVRGSSHFGMASYYPMLAARQDMIGFACTNGMPNLAHFGSKKGMLGTNPFSVAIPVSGQEPMVLDIACSVTARGNISNAKREGLPIPLGWAIGRDGEPTTDPDAALSGSVLPFGGYKGSGIAVVVDMLSGVLSGASYGIHLREAENADHLGGPNVGHFFMAIDLRALGNPEELKARAASALRELRAAPLAPGFEQIFMPGDIEAKKYVYNTEHGILIGAGAWKELCEEFEALGITENPGKYVLGEELMDR